MEYIRLRPGREPEQAHADATTLSDEIRVKGMLRRNMGQNTVLYCPRAKLDAAGNYSGSSYICRARGTLVVETGILVHEEEGCAPASMDKVERGYWARKFSPLPGSDGKQVIKYIVTSRDSAPGWQSYIPASTTRELIDTYEYLSDLGSGACNRATSILEELEKRGIETGGWGG